MFEKHVSHPTSALSFEEFPPTPYKEWRSLVENELKGAPFEKKLVTRTPEGIAIQPIYTAEDASSDTSGFPGFHPFRRGSSPDGHARQGWEISQELVYGNPREFNAAAHMDLARGLKAINLNLDAATRAGKDPDTAAIGEVGRGGVSIATMEDLARALDGIDLKTVPFFIRTGASALPFAALLFAHLRKRNISPAEIRGCIEMDPLGVLSHEGELSHSLEDSYKEMAHLTEWASVHAPHVQTMCAHGRPYHESGADAAQELAFVLATGAEYLRALGKRGIEPDVSAPRLRFSLSIGPRFFLEIAKLRAARVLWARIVKEFGGNNEAARMHLHARTSQYTQTILDPYVNMLRVTLEAFAAALGGCDSMHTAPFDEVIRPADDFSRRIARNTQLILAHESNVHRVIDAAGGSWYVENLTDQLAAKAWEWFQAVEKRGGMAQALLAGWAQEEISKTAKARAEALAHRRLTLVGTNIYANPAEELIAPAEPDYAEIHRIQARRIAQYRVSHDNRHNTFILHRLAAILDSSPHNLLESAIAAAEAGSTLGEITRTLRSTSTPGPIITPLSIHRLAEPFEKLRFAAARHQRESGHKPRAFLCNLGPLRQHKVRADFSRAFLEIAGFEVAAGPGAETPEEAAGQAASSNAPIVVICSTDETYPELVPPLIRLLRKQGCKSTVVLAGYPSDHVDMLHAAGVDEFLHVRSNALELLTKLLSNAGVTL